MTKPRAAATPNGVRLGIIGTGWIGLTRARTAAAGGRVTELHLADINRERVLSAARNQAPYLTGAAAAG
jgi:predicted dehydrogenase